MIVEHLNLGEAIDYWTQLLVEDGIEVDAGHWQGVPTEGRPDLQTKELTNVSFVAPVLALAEPIIPKSYPAQIAQLQAVVRPNMPWAEEHFHERVSRDPSNPGEAYRSWPWWHGQTKDTQHEGKFDHTYQERLWPKQAGRPQGDYEYTDDGNKGIRYTLGDLDDLVDQLHEYPYTRQGFIPIFFPEDTGNVHRGRVPCTLGYHFMLREHQMNMWYFIRSCDAVRHFRDDIYLAVRLLLWVLEELRQKDGVFWYDIIPGYFTFVCPSLHYHKGDEHHIRT